MPQIRYTYGANWRPPLIFQLSKERERERYIQREIERGAMNLFDMQ